MNGNSLNIEENSNNEEQLKEKIKEFFNSKYPIEKIENKYFEDLKTINKLSSTLKIIEKRFYRIEEISHQKCYKCRLRLLQELDNKNNKSYTPDKLINYHNHSHNNLSPQKNRCKTPELLLNKKKNIKKINNDKSFFHVNTKNNEHNNNQNNLKRSIMHNKNNNIKIINHSYNNSNITNHSENGQNKKNDKLNNQKESHFKKVYTTIEKSPNKKLIKLNEEKLYKVNTISTNKNKRTLTPNLELNKKKKLIKNQFDELQDKKKHLSYVELAQKKNYQHKLNKSHDNIIKNGIIETIDDVKNNVNGIHKSVNLIQSKNKEKEKQKLNMIRKKRSNSFNDTIFDNNIGKKIDYSIINNNQIDINNNNDNKLDNKINYETENIEYNISSTKNNNFQIQTNDKKNINISLNVPKTNYNSERNSERNIDKKNKDNKGYSKLSLKVKRIKENNIINEYRIENEYIKKKDNYKNNNNNNNFYNKNLTKTEITENNDNNLTKKELNNEKYNKLISSIKHNINDDKFNIDIFENKKKEINNNNIFTNEKVKEVQLNKQLKEEELKNQKEKEKQTKYLQCLILLLKSGFLIPKQSFYLITNSKQLLSQFSIIDLIKQTISNLELNYNKLNEYVSKYNINQFEEPFKYNEKSKEKLNLITQNNEIDLCSKSQPFIIINLFTIIYIILGENYLEIPTKNLIINLYQTIFKKYKINSISKFNYI